jgi:hypothetical protein
MPDVSASQTCAAMMNKYFICIKVDREERPDVDRMYMTYLQVSTDRHYKSDIVASGSLTPPRCPCRLLQEEGAGPCPSVSRPKKPLTGNRKALTGFLSAVLTPTLEPVFAGTYFPLGKFMGLLDKISEL